jgi:hypothetical protein
MADDLRWKDFIAVQNLDQSDIQNENFIDICSGLFRIATPYMKFLCDALEVPF